MEKKFEREVLLFGEEAVRKLNKTHVAVFGIGGVGGHAAESLVRAGIGCLSLIDGDTVEESNINRQLVATEKTIGMVKTSVAKQRFQEIFGQCELLEYPIFLSEETKDQFDFDSFDYVLDCIDDVPAKILLIRICQEKNIPIISAMGAGNKIDPSGFMVEDIYKTSVCPLAKVMRKKCKEAGIKKLKCVYSKEEPKHVLESVGSVSYVPPVMGMTMAGACIRDLVEKEW